MSEISQIDNQRIAKLRLAKQKHEEDNQISSPKIQRIHVVLQRNARFVEYCTPKVISFGPIHHGDRHLQQGEHYKLLWTSMYVEEHNKQHDKVTTDQQAQSLLKKVKDNIGELKKLFTEDAIGMATDDDLAWMLFVDGCSLLHFMAKTDRQHPEVLNLKLDQMMYIWIDIILLENQLPWRLLEMLSNKEAILIKWMLNFQSMGDPRFVIPKKREADLEQPITEVHSVVDVVKRKPFHLLDFVRSFFTADSHNDQVEQNGKDVKNQQDGAECKEIDPDEKLGGFPTYKNIRDLKAAGILVKPSKEYECKVKWSGISFTSKSVYGELRLPIFWFTNVAPYFFRNLIAYEMCPDFRNGLESCSFICFMDSLIDDGEDVKELRLAGVIKNLFGSDEELAKLINDLSGDLLTKLFNCIWSSDAMAYSKKYMQVQNQVEQHYSNRWRTSIFRAINKYNVYFNGPWSVIAFIAALAALALTFVQTWYTVYPKKP